ncbi:hypothetical protein EPUS_05292 [Endocarpon pusillum Z07020]|uniref:Thioesterase domain-containing protein n=1 Tax=Endocarpon pusillum (strain Z07020 / HMAS-L-300199) TaxID=1263415 RepID=U1G960_ENDPU|nr:uncharacterized protein EPUS_05292 [Endocarpon pusillum Z07020]ERF68211.1 hypothetical protein EPUS_05292 [Endocarpon pusillum Z07020]
MPQSETGTRSYPFNVAPNFPTETTLGRNLWNATGLALCSLLFGFGAGTGLITWAYLQGPFEAGSEEESEMLEEITEMMNEYPAMEVLLNDPGWEEWPVPPRMVSGDAGKGLHFVTGTLTGSKGIIQRIFFHRNLGMLTMIVYFGNGIEGWPDVVHGGILSTMLKEAMQRVASEVFPLGTGDLHKLAIQFKKKVIPGEVYTLYALPASNAALSNGESIESLYKMQPTERRDAIIAYIERGDASVDQPTFDQTTLAFGYGVFRVRHPFQLDEHGNIT